MNNPETLIALDTQDTRRIQIKPKTQHRKLKRWATPIMFDRETENIFIYL